jgi:hypothetical protein
VQGYYDDINVKKWSVSFHLVQCWLQFCNM